MILTWVKNHVVFITPFLYLKIISMSVDHSNSTFFWRIHSIALFRVADRIKFNEKKEIINKIV